MQRLTRKGQATRDRIVEAAAGLMFRQGVAAAARLLESGMAAAEAVRVLAGRLGCSQRQARRYVARAAELGRVEVPGEGTVFTVRLPVRLAAAVREHARASGRTISSVAAQALEEFLSRAHGDRPSR